MPVINPVPKAVAKAAMDAFNTRRHEHAEKGRKAVETGCKKIKRRRSGLAAMTIGMALAAALAGKANSAEISDAKQYAMVLTATEIMEAAQCGTAEKPISRARLTENGIDVRGRDSQAFLTTINAVAQIYVADPKGFCRRAFLAAGR